MFYRLDYKWDLTNINQRIIKLLHRLHLPNTVAILNTVALLFTLHYQWTKVRSSLENIFVSLYKLIIGNKMTHSNLIWTILFPKGRILTSRSLSGKKIRRNREWRHHYTKSNEISLLLLSTKRSNTISYNEKVTISHIGIIFISWLTSWIMGFIWNICIYIHTLNFDYI